MSIDNSDKRRWNHAVNGRGEKQPSPKHLHRKSGTVSHGSFCDCGAWRGSLGLEPEPEMFVTHLISIFREVRRVLRHDGIVFLNLGDSYARKRHGSVKAKDLVGIPWRVALALQADGWYLRRDIIWSKPNPMPSSVVDRPTSSHEYLFLLSKRPRYQYNAAAIAEPVSDAMMQQISDGYQGEALKGYAEAGVQNPSETKRRIIERARLKMKHPSGWSSEDGAHDDLTGRYAKKAGRNNALDNPRTPNPRKKLDAIAFDNRFESRPTRNRRSVWTIATAPYRDAHFATFPPALVEPCILAGSAAGDFVLDPFGGSGTTAEVAISLGRRSAVFDLSSEYCGGVAKRRMSKAQRGLPLISGYESISKNRRRRP